MQPTEHTFTSFDGAQLFYRAWMPDSATPNSNPTKALLLFHRGHEHSARWQETVDALNLPDCAVFAWDQRGHGKSPGERGGAPDMAALTKDADAFARHIAAAHGIETRNTVVLAHSVGAVIASAWVHDFAPPIRGLILGAPAFRVRLYLPLAVPLLRLKQKLLGPGTVKSYVKAKMLTHDPAQAAAYDADPLIFRQIAVNMLLDLHDTSTRILADAGAIDVPTLILAAEKDWVVDLGAQKTFFKRLGSRVKQFEMLPGFFHAIFHETDRATLINRIRTFILDRFEGAPLASSNSPTPANPALINADQGGLTRTEYDLLRTPGNLYWSLTRAFTKLGGHLSRGIRIGWQYGFDSGVMLDYVYENTAHGHTPLGTFIDRCYLDSIGWRGIRIRRGNLEKLLRASIETQHKSGNRVHILDIAAGAGRYVLETMHAMQSKQTTGTPITATLRDYKQENLDSAKQHVHRLNLTQQVTLERADAFDRDSLAAISPRPTIAIVSGLFELFPDNEPLRHSLAGLAAAIDDGGHLIYTNQPWHPQLEFIARVLTNREGKPWIMRRRTQAEIDELVRAAGFEKIAQDIDPWGIFTVSVARRVKR